MKMDCQKIEKSGFVRCISRWVEAGPWSLLIGLFVLNAASFSVFATEQATGKSQTGRSALVDIQVVTGAGEPKIRLFTSDPVDLTGLLVDAPDRFIISLPPVRDRLPERKKTFEFGPVASYEFIEQANGQSKIEFNLREMLAPVQIAVEPLANGAAYSATVNLRHVDRREFSRLVKLGKQEKPVISKPSRPVLAERSERKPVIVIDPGHGGADTGAEGIGGVLEKDIVFAFSKALTKALQSTGAVQVRLTRDADVFVGLDRRVEIARSFGADYFISIHADTIASTTDVRGMTVYLGSDRASDAEAARLAESENKSDLIGGLVETRKEEAIAGILGDLMMRETRMRSAELARVIIERMTAASALNKNPIRSAAFRVLRAPDFPSVLIELGYMSSPYDIDLLTSEVWMGKAAESLSTAILEFLSSKKPMPAVKSQ